MVTELLEFLHSVVFILLNSSLKLNGTAYLRKYNRNDKLHFGYISLMLVVLPIKGLEFYSAQRPKEKFVSYWNRTTLLNNISNTRKKKKTFLSPRVFGLHESLTRTPTKWDKFLKRAEVPFHMKSFHNDIGHSGCARMQVWAHLSSASLQNDPYFHINKILLFILCRDKAQA